MASIVERAREIEEAIDTRATIKVRKRGPQGGGREGEQK